MNELDELQDSTKFKRVVTRRLFEDNAKVEVFDRNELELSRVQAMFEGREAMIAAGNDKFNFLRLTETATNYYLYIEDCPLKYENEIVLKQEHIGN